MGCTSKIGELTHPLGSFGGRLPEYLGLPDQAGPAIVLWAISTYLLDVADCAPILAVTSPTKRCGKTRLLELLAGLCCRALPAANITPSSLFRLAEDFQPTLLVDEADSFLANSEELRGLLNSGYRRPTAFVVRVEETKDGGREPRRFCTWGAKTVALIGRLPDTLEDRSIVVSMRRRAPSEAVARFRSREIKPELAPLKSKLARWTQDHAEAVGARRPELPDGLNDRAMEL